MRSETMGKSSASTGAAVAGVFAAKVGVLLALWVTVSTASSIATRTLASSSSSSPSSSPSPSPSSQLTQPTPFNVPGEEVSDEEWVELLTASLERHGLLGRIIERPAPHYVINVDYPEEGACVHLGNQLPPRQTRMPPSQLTFPTNGSGGLFTLMAIDPDVPVRGPRNSDNSNNHGTSPYTEFLQWLVINIPDEDIQRGQVLAEYLGPLPSARGRPHRFVFIVHRQADVIDPSALPRKAEPCDWAVRTRFSARRFAQLHRLGRPVAVNYFITRFDPTVPQSIEQCLLRRQSLLDINQRILQST